MAQKNSSVIVWVSCIATPPFAVVMESQIEADGALGIGGGGHSGGYN
jgi:hypothetical protein